MRQELPKQQWKWTPVFAVAGALVLAVLLFLMIPLTQMRESVEEKEFVVREVEIVMTPPPEPPPPDDPEPPPPEPRSAKVEPISEREPVLDVEPLDVELSAGSGEAIAMGAEIPAFRVERDAIGDIEKFFTFEDLPEAPRLIHTPNFRFPQQLVRRGIRDGEVVVEIDILPDGRARFRRIVSSTHADLEPVAREIVEGARFTKPMIDGKTQTVRGRFPLTLQH